MDIDLTHKSWLCQDLIDLWVRAGRPSYNSTEQDVKIRRGIISEWLSATNSALPRDYEVLMKVVRKWSQIARTPLDERKWHELYRGQEHQTPKKRAGRKPAPQSLADPTTNQDAETEHSPNPEPPGPQSHPATGKPLHANTDNQGSGHAGDVHQYGGGSSGDANAKGARASDAPRGGWPFRRVAWRLLVLLVLVTLVWFTGNRLGALSPSDSTGATAPSSSVATQTGSPNAPRSGTLSGSTSLEVDPSAADPSSATSGPVNGWSANFSSPARGAKVPHLVQVRGQARIPAGMQLWLLLKSPDTRLNVTTLAAIPLSGDGGFKKTIGVGRGSCDIGSVNEVIAVYTAPTASIPTQARALSPRYLHLTALPADAVEIGATGPLTLENFTGAPDQCPRPAVAEQ